MIFKVNGYWKDTKAEFNDYFISEYHDLPCGWKDSDIFYYGLSETDLQESSIEDGLDFVITSYEVDEE